MNRKPVSCEKIKVLLTVPHLTSSASPYKQMMALARYLPKERFDLTICALRKQGVEETGPVLDSLGIPYYIARYRIKSIRNIGDFIKAEKMHKNFGPFDIQHSYDFTTLPLEAFTARLHGRRFIHHQRNLNIGGHRLFLWLRILFSNRVIACSPSTKEFLINLGIRRSKIEMVFNGIDIGDQSRTQVREHRFKRKDNPTLLMVSNIIPLKRIEDAINVVFNLHEIYPEIILKIAGAVFDPHYYELLNNLIIKKNLQERVKFLGSLSNPEVIAEMKKSDIFLHCAEHEAFGWVLLEAFSQHLPVIAGNSEGPSDIIRDGENGLLYPVGDVSALNRRIIEILHQKELSERITEQAFFDVQEKYSALTMVNRISQVYEDVMRRV